MGNFSCTSALVTHAIHNKVIILTNDISVFSLFIFSVANSSSMRLNQFLLHQASRSSIFERIIFSQLSQQFYVKHIHDHTQPIVHQPFDRLLSDFQSRLVLSYPEKSIACIEVSVPQSSEQYPFHMLNPRLCDDILTAIKEVNARGDGIEHVVLTGSGRSFLVGPQLSFLSKVCMGGRSLVLPEGVNAPQDTPNMPTFSSEERLQDYERTLVSFLKLFAALNFSNENALRDCLARLRELRKFHPKREFSQQHAEYAEKYNALIRANAPSHFMNKNLITGVNGISFGIGTFIAQSADVIYGNRRTTWDVYRSPEELVQYVKSYPEAQDADQSEALSGITQKEIRLASATELYDSAEIHAILPDAQKFTKHVIKQVKRIAEKNTQNSELLS